MDVLSLEALLADVRARALSQGVRWVQDRLGPPMPSAGDSHYIGQAQHAVAGSLANMGDSVSSPFQSEPSDHRPVEDQATGDRGNAGLVSQDLLPLRQESAGPTGSEGEGLVPRPPPVTLPKGLRPRQRSKNTPLPPQKGGAGGKSKDRSPKKVPTDIKNADHAVPSNPNSNSASGALQGRSRGKKTDMGTTRERRDRVVREMISQDSMAMIDDIPVAAAVARPARPTRARKNTNRSERRSRSRSRRSCRCSCACGSERGRSPRRARRSESPGRQERRWDTPLADAMVKASPTFVHQNLELDFDDQDDIYKTSHTLKQMTTGSKESVL
ncbi:uncharacterized protein O3C94_007069 [Discoglossus pictus]